MSFISLIVFTFLFGFVAGTAALLITYDEYVHHFSDKKKVLKTALSAGIIAFVFFLVLTLLFLPFLMKIITTKIITHG